MRKLADKWPGLVFLLGWLLLWEILARRGFVTPEQLPAPSDIVRAAVDAFRDDALGTEAWLTTRRLTIGYVIAIMWAVPAGCALGRWKTLHGAFSPLIEFLRPMPVIAILPIAAFVLGLGDRMSFAVIAFSSGWIILLHAMDGIRGVDPVLVDTGRTFGARGIRQFFTIILPAAAPSLFTGLRIGLGIAVIVTVVVELATGFDGGLGSFVGTAQGALRIPETYAGIALIGLLGYAIGQAFLQLEGRLMEWHRRSRQH